MTILRNRNTVQKTCYFLETFLFSRSGKVRVHCSRLIFLACRGSQKIFMRTANYSGRVGCDYFGLSAFEELKLPFRVLFFLVCSFSKNSRYLLVTFFFCLTGEVGVTHPGL